MIQPSQPGNCDWKPLYEAALSEADERKLLERIAAARMAILDRIEVSLTTSRCRESIGLWTTHFATCANWRGYERATQRKNLSEHPKAAIHDHLKSGHTFRRNVQDIDSSGRVSSLSQHGECLEGREETTNHSLGTTGMVSAKDPRGHASSSRDNQRLSARRECGNMATGKMETRR